MIWRKPLENCVPHMKTKLVNRYYCDYCKKSGGSAGHMKRHEIGCTNNPNRVCGVCKLAGIKQRQLNELIASLVADSEREQAMSNELIPFCEPIELGKTASGCAACMLTAIRASSVCVTFDFKETSLKFFERLNAARENGCTIPEWEGDGE